MKQSFVLLTGLIFWVACVLQLSVSPRVMGSDFFNREPEMANAVLTGEVIWRLPRWHSLSWRGDQTVEIWLWDDEKNERGEKLAEAKVHYVTRYQASGTILEGRYATDEPVATPENARVVIHAQLNIRVNNDPKEEEAVSAVVTLPTSARGEIKVPTVRRRVSR